MNSKGPAILVVVILAVSGMVYAVMPFADSSQDRIYSITYVMDGGVNNSENPTEYVAGTGAVLLDPYKEGYIFEGWYTDSSFTNRVSSISKTSAGDIKLYALWSVNLVGRSFVLDFNGDVTQSTRHFMQTESTVIATITGTEKYTYVAYDPERGYQMTLDYSYLTVTSSEPDGTEESGSDTYWTGEMESEGTWYTLNDEEVDYNGGTVICSVYRRTTGNTVETQWIMDDWIPYKIDYTSTQQTSIFSTQTAHVVYSINSVSYSVEGISYDVTGYGDEGITVTGSGTYDAFDSITLTASVSDGYDFSGWYDSKGRLLSTSLRYTIPAVTSDTSVYAANTERYERSVDIDEDASFSLSYGPGTWDVTDLDIGTSVYTYDGATLDYTFASPGIYRISHSTSSGDSPMGTYITVFVDGTSVKTFSWKDNDKTSYEYSIGIRYSDFMEYRDKDVSRSFGSFEHCRQFVTYEDPYIVRIAEEFDSMLSGKSDAKRIDVVLTFTQYIQYTYDQDSMGEEEYWKYPVETLFDMNGDCEDTSILFCAIVKAMGYDCAMLLFDGHMAAGVTFDGQPTSYTTFDADGNSYLYCETTATGYRVGAIPSGELYHRYTISVI
ncbi:MAG: InlB B-repeat-containing protein [Candidatus Methanomethylophilaceae archaeon]